MLKIKSIAVLGGDVRQKYLASFLSDEGFTVSGTQKLCDECSVFSGYENCIAASDAVLLPLPVTKDGKNIYSCDKEEIPLDGVLDCLRDNQILFVGKADDVLKEKLGNKQIRFFDYFTDEEMTVKNAVATAEGAIALAIQNTATTVFSSKILVTGYGRISKALVKMLKGFGCDVTVAARSPVQRTWAQLDGAKTVCIEQLTDKNEYSLVFNTVPHIVFTKKELLALSRNVLIIDLASFPGGVDNHVAKSLGIDVITAGGLPSRFSPQSAGEFIGQTVVKIIKEEF